LIHLYVQLNKKNVQQATAESRLIVESVKKHGFSDDVLDVAKRNFSYKIASAFEGSASLNSMMANDWFQNGGITPTLTDFISCIDNVKNDDIISIANQTFNASKLTVMNE
jgi:predicted Zn-dependent peptidase